MTDNVYPDGRPARRVLRWVDDWQEMSLPDELMTRPQQWAVIADRVQDVGAAKNLQAELGDQFETRLYNWELQAKFIGEFITEP